MHEQPPNRWRMVSWLNRSRSKNRIFIFHWSADHDWNQTLRHWTQAFVVGSYLLAAAWSLTYLLAGMYIVPLLYGFHFAWISTVALVLVYRSNDPPKFRTLLSPYVWAMLMVLAAAIAVESLLKGYDWSAILSGVVGALGALLPLAVKALNDMWMERLKRRNAAAHEPINGLPG